LQKYYTYIAYNESNTLQDIGTTNNLKRRFKLFNLKYSCICKLVYFEEHLSSKEANLREDELLQLHETILAELVKSTNPMIIDLNTNNDE